MIGSVASANSVRFGRREQGIRTVRLRHGATFRQSLDARGPAVFASERYGVSGNAATAYSYALDPTNRSRALRRLGNTQNAFQALSVASMIFAIRLQPECLKAVVR